MQQQNQNKEFILDYFNALSGKEKSKDVIDKYMTDESLMAHIDFFESAFPCYEIIPREMYAEDNHVIVIANFKGVHKGELNGIPPTFKEANIPFAIRYTIENNKISSHWILADQMMLMEQLGVIPAAEAVH